MIRLMALSRRIWQQAMTALVDWFKKQLLK